MSENKDVFDGLRATFDLGEHELRPLIAKDNFTQWSVYIRREAITNRLDELFGPFEWDFEISQRVDKGGYVAYNGAIVIKGRRRANNGGASGSDENTEKAALTDCFKRCASSWGIGLYLQNTPRITTGPIGKTDNNRFKVDYSKQADMEAEALRKFGEWWVTLSGETVTTPAPPPTAQQAKAKLEGSKTRRLEDNSPVRADKIKYIAVGKQSYVMFNTPNKAKVYSRALLRDLGDDWKQWADDLIPDTDEASATAVELPAPVLVTSEKHTRKDDGEVYYTVTALEVAS